MNKDADNKTVVKTESSDLIIGLVGAVGIDLDKIIEPLKIHLQDYGYKHQVIKIAKEIIPVFKTLEKFKTNNDGFIDQYDRITKLMNAGNTARRKSTNDAILAMGAAAKIKQYRIEEPKNSTQPIRLVYIIDSLKHKEEVLWLRKVYGEGFYLIGVYADEEDKRDYLKNIAKISDDKDITKLINRDRDELGKIYGQHTGDVFELSDFFLCYKDSVEPQKDKNKIVSEDLERFIRLLFNDPFISPTFDEHAMFIAFATAARSADLSRQVGAVVANNKTCSILATGANDNPYFGGGNYPYIENKGRKYEVNNLEAVLDIDIKKDREENKIIPHDPNQRHIQKIIKDVQERIINKYNEQEKNALETLKTFLNESFIDKNIKEIILKKFHEKNISSEDLEKLFKNSLIKDITEYSRSIHAEMEAILSCARNRINLQGMTLYCTTFPCHNYAKHIIDAGIAKVVYIEPYPKSKTEDLFWRQIELSNSGDIPSEKKIRFEPFVGVGPGRYIDLFSLTLGSGASKERKHKNGDAAHWEKNSKTELRLPLSNISFLQREERNRKDFKKILKDKFRIN